MIVCGVRCRALLSCSQGKLGEGACAFIVLSSGLSSHGVKWLNARSRGAQIEMDTIVVKFVTQQAELRVGVRAIGAFFRAPGARVSTREGRISRKRLFRIARSRVAKAPVPFRARTAWSRPPLWFPCAGPGLLVLRSASMAGLENPALDRSMILRFCATIADAGFPSEDPTPPTASFSPPADPPGNLSSCHPVAVPIVYKA